MPGLRENFSIAKVRLVIMHALEIPSKLKEISKEILLTLDASLVAQLNRNKEINAITHQCQKSDKRYEELSKCTSKDTKSK